MAWLFLGGNQEFLDRLPVTTYFVRKKYSDQLSTTALVRRNATKNLEKRCFILS